MEEIKMSYIGKYSKNITKQDGSKQNSELDQPCENGVDYSVLPNVAGCNSYADCLSALTDKANLNSSLKNELNTDNQSEQIKSAYAIKSVVNIETKNEGNINSQGIGIDSGVVQQTTHTDDLSGLEPASSNRRESLKTSMSSGLPGHQYTSVQMPMMDEKKSVLTHEDSWIRSAIPQLPLSMSIICLVLNILLPGSGTLVSGLCIFCCGKSRPPLKNRQDAIFIMCVNAWVGVAQLFTVTFLLVGWFWSLAWGIKMIYISLELRHQQKQQRDMELQAMALSAFGSAVTR